LRKGRFDEVFWVDLPNFGERVEIVQAALRANGRAEADVDAEAVAKACETFTGSEIAALVPDALFMAFADGKREPVTADLIAASRTVTPLAKTAAEKIAALRDWANGRARAATSAEASTTGDKRAVGRMLDI
jgi:SpoVK/Ycf46/Vps4 family AAA+-type ATPase